MHNHVIQLFSLHVWDSSICILYYFKIPFIHTGFTLTEINRFKLDKHWNNEPIDHPMISTNQTRLGWVDMYLSRHVSGWADTCPTGWIRVWLSGYVSGWADTCPAGRIRVRLGGYVSVWEDTCPAGRDKCQTGWTSVWLGGQVSTCRGCLADQTCVRLSNGSPTYSRLREII